MKKIILAVIAVMLVASPAMAQKVEYQQKKEQVKPAKKEENSNGIRR